MKASTWFQIIAFVCFLWVPSAFAADAAPNFTLRDINNEEVTLSDYKGKVVVISFWATWCGPCKEEMPYLQTLLDEKRDKGVEVFSISIDDQRTMSQVKPHIKKNQYNFTVLKDPKSDVITSYNPSKNAPVYSRYRPESKHR